MPAPSTSSGRAIVAPADLTPEERLRELADLGHVTRARLTQIMNLRFLAPDIQEAILFLDPVTSGRDPITERHLRPIAAEPGWRNQRRAWRRLAPDNGILPVHLKVLPG